MRGGRGCFCTVSLYDFNSEGSKQFSTSLPHKDSENPGMRRKTVAADLCLTEPPPPWRPKACWKLQSCDKNSWSRPSTITVWMGRCVVNYYAFLHPFRIYNLCLKVRAWFFCAVNRSFIPKKKKKLFLREREIAM